MTRQRTLREAIVGSGTGLHSGVLVKFRMEPAAPDSGIVFVRTDLGRAAAGIPAHIDYVVGTTLCNTLGRGPVTVQTVEHLLAVVRVLGVDNARVVLDGPEVPIFDGSGLQFVRMIDEVGLVEQAASRKQLVVTRPVAVQEDDRWVRLEPLDGFSVSCTIDFSHPLIGKQAFAFHVTKEAFVQEIAPARTFGFLRDVERLKGVGLARGGGLHNALVFDEEDLLNTEGFRGRDEPVRHKVLDAIGDLSLLSVPIRARYAGHKGGHALNLRLMKQLLAEPDQYVLESS